MDPLRHYALVGAAQGLDPGPRFSTEFYLEHNPDVSPGTNALLHYLRHGRPRGSKIAPSTVERQWLTLTLDERFPNLRPLHVYASASAPKRISDGDRQHQQRQPLRRRRNGADLRLAPGPAHANGRCASSPARSRRPRQTAEPCSRPTGFHGKEMSTLSSRRATRRTDGSSTSPPGDLFVTTSWWTTWATRASVDPASIIYLVQEDERRFYPGGRRLDSLRGDPRRPAHQRASSTPSPSSTISSAVPIPMLERRRGSSRRSRRF